MANRRPTPLINLKFFYGEGGLPELLTLIWNFLGGQAFITLQFINPKPQSIERPIKIKLLLQFSFTAC